MRHRSTRAAAAFVVTAVLAPILFAQSAPPPQAGSQPKAPRPDFAVSVNLVTLDVIPRTEDGQFVSDMTKDDFEVVEDGTRQDVQSVVLVHGGRVFNLVRPAESAPAAQEGIILPTSRREADTPGRIFVLLIDDLHFTAVDTPYVRQLLKKVATTLIHPGDMFAVFSTGPSSIEIPVTYDHSKLDLAISKVAGHGMGYRDIMDARDGSQGPQGLRHNAHVAFSTAYELIGNLEKVRDRRKAVILVSTGYDFDPFPGGRTGTDQVFGGRYGTPWVNADNGDRFLSLEQQNNRFADADLAAELAALTGAANRVNAAIYALDPRGVVGTTTAVDQIDPTEMRTYISKTQASLRALAEGTDGIAVVNDNEFDGALKQIDAATSDYYILGYHSTNADAKQRSRSVEVKSRRAGVKMRARSWYRTRPEPTPTTEPKR
ncbi:MAG: VWA domain-containing protein [Vicinamibacterales bacterium]